MKWMLVFASLLLVSCGFVRTTEVVEYRQVVVEPVVDEVVVTDADPLDVTVTEFEYY